MKGWFTRAPNQILFAAELTQICVGIAKFGHTRARLTCESGSRTVIANIVNADNGVLDFMDDRDFLGLNRHEIVYSMGVDVLSDIEILGTLVR